MTQSKTIMLPLAAFFLALFSASFRPTTAASGDNLFINCGASGAVADADNRIWVGDVDSQLQPKEPSSTSSYPSTLDAAPAVPFATARVSASEFAYFLPVPPGRVFLRLYFYPADYLGQGSAASAVFHVSAGSHLLLANFTPALQAAQSLGSPHVVVREYSVNASSSVDNGLLRLTFTPSAGVVPAGGAYAFVNGIEVVRAQDLFTPREPIPFVGVPGQPYPLEAASAAFETMERLNAGGGAVAPGRDSGGQYRSWAADYLQSGRIQTTEPGVKFRYSASVPEYFAPRAVYGTQRAMTTDVQTNRRINLTWTVPVDPGFYYLVRLHFCELSTLYNLPNKRAFDVFINRLVGFQEADVFAWSNGVGVPLYKDYVTFMPNGFRKMDLRVDLHPDETTKPEYVDAVLNGLEVFKISDYNGNLAFRGPAVPSTAATRVEGGEGEEGYHGHHSMMACCLVPVAVVIICLVSLWVFSSYHGALPGLTGCCKKKNEYSQIVNRYVWSKSAIHSSDDLKKPQRMIAVGADGQTTNGGLPVFESGLKQKRSAKADRPLDVDSEDDESLPLVNKRGDDTEM